MSRRVAGRFATADEYTLAIVSQLLEDCAGYRDGDELAKQRQAALDYYFMRPRGDELTGRSAVVSGDLSAMVDAVLSQIMANVASGRIAEFDPEGADDEEQAALETDCVTKTIFQKGNRGYLKLQAAVKNALLLANGIGKARVEDEPRARERVFRNVTPEAYAELTKDRPGVKLEHINWDGGTLRYSERRPQKRIRTGDVDPANFVYTRDWDSCELARIPCVGERHVSTRSDLITEEGFPRKLVEKATAFTDMGGARSARSIKSSPRPPNRTSDASLDLIEWFELYVLIDVNDDGVAERRRVCIIPNKTLFANEASDIPYAVGFALINPGRLLGVSLFHKIKQTQDTNTALKRAALDNASAANKSRLLYLSNHVDQTDLEDGRVNGAIAVTGVADVRQAAAALVVPDITAGLLQMIQEEKRSRTELGGASLELASGQAQLTDRVGSQGLDRAYSVMEQLAALMARTFAETFVCDMYLLVHRLMRENIREPVTFTRKGKPVQTTPSDWPERDSITPKLGMSPGERARKLGALQTNLNAQIMLAREGMTGIIVDPTRFYALLMDYNRLAELENPEQWYIDPDSDAARETVAKRDASAQQERIAQQKLMAKALGFEQLRIALQRHEGDADRVVEVFKAILGAESDQAKTVGTAAASFELAELEADRAAEQADKDAETVGKVDKALEALKGLKNAAPAN
jgi:hypothetical protein